MRAKNNLMIAGIMILFSAIALLVLFSDLFFVYPEFGGERGSAYFILFMYWEQDYNPTIPLIVAWCLQCVAVLALFAVPFLKEKPQAITLGVSGLLLIATAVTFLCAVPIYQWAQGDIIQETASMSISYAPICNAIFAGIAGLLGIYAGYTTFKNA